MKICAVDLKGNDAIICIMSLANGLFDLPKIRVPKLAIQDASSAEQIKKFQFDFHKLLQDYQVDHVVIKGRATKGKFAGGAVGFKLEAAIQLIPEVSVSIVSSSFVKDKLKKSQVEIDFRDTGLKKFQQAAFETAFAYLN